MQLSRIRPVPALVLAGFFFVSSSALADQDRAQLNYSGQALNQSVYLSHDVYRTEYHQVWVTKTCYRTEVSHERVCSHLDVAGDGRPDGPPVLGDIHRGDGGRPPRIGAGGGGSDVSGGIGGVTGDIHQGPPPGGAVCQDTVHTIEIPYDCSGYETQAQQVFDHTVNSQIDLQIAASQIAGRGVISIDWSGIVSAQSSDLAFVEASHDVLSDNDSTVHVASRMTVVSKSQLLAAIATPISEFQVSNNNILSFKIARRSRPDLVAINLEVKTLKKVLFVIADDKTLLQRPLARTEYTATLAGNQELIQIDLAKLNAAPVTGKRNRVSVRLSMSNGNVINSDLDIAGKSQSSSVRVNR